MDGGQQVAAEYVDGGLRFDGDGTALGKFKRPAPTGFRVVPYEPWHLRAISLQPHQEHLGAYLRATGFADQMTVSGPCWTAMVGDKPIGCGGFIKHWVGRSSTWAALSDDAGRHMLALTRAVRRGLADHPAERIEATVVAGFEAGMRWARTLGFEEEGLLRRYQRGADHVAFVLLKPPAAARGASPSVEPKIIL